MRVPELRGDALGHGIEASGCLKSVAMVSRYEAARRPRQLERVHQAEACAIARRPRAVRRTRSASASCRHAVALALDSNGRFAVIP